jgi:hypothetical protein
MIKNIFLLLFVTALPLRAANLTSIPSPMAQGGMIHVYVSFQNVLTNSFNVSTDAGTPQLKPLSLWAPGDNFLPADPWYSALSPSAQGQPFNSQYGFLIDSGTSDFPPAGASIGIRLLSATPGLQAHFYRATDPKSFTPVFVPAHDYVLWTGNMWHPVFTAPGAGNYEATFQFFLANASGASVADFTTTASAVPGYSTAAVTLQFSAVPEPSSLVLLAGGLGVLWWRLRRR